ncbi:MAG: HAMP domain-containing histidine kinase [Alphaproteobacteria bacterium]|nr:HAMP domain-containing histidine kinase [Alphaproteobacteria bacterium]
MFRPQKFSLPPLRRSLSARLLLLTIFFVMLAEVLIYAPSVSNFRLTWLNDRLASADLAILALEAAPDENLSTDLKSELLGRVDAFAIVLTRPDRRLLLYTQPPPAVEITVDLRQSSLMSGIGDAFGTLARRGDGVMRVIGESPQNPSMLVEVVLNEAQLRAEMFGYSRNILLLSIVISVFTATLLYLALQWLMVRPMRRITEGITEFSRDPQNAATGVKPSHRDDEIGVAQSVLVEMQDDLRASLKQQERLAALGSAVSKINHDLRGILSTAVLMSDRLSALDSPEVKRISGPLIQSIDRAINLCTRTLNFVRDEGPELHQSRFRLTELIDEVAADLLVLGEGQTAVNGTVTALANRVPNEVVVEADRDQLYRVFANLTRNASQVGAHAIDIKLGPDNSDNKYLVIDVSDDGPGMVKSARDGLFKAFAGSARKGGTGLGLVIVRDVMRAHGGEIELLSSDDSGTVFRLTLPRAD